MPKRFIFKKWNDSQDLTKCFNCEKLTLFFIYDRKTGEEFFCCLKCASKKYKIKNTNKYSSFLKKAILQQNSLIKNEEKCEFEVVREELTPNISLEQKMGVFL